MHPSEREMQAVIFDEYGPADVLRMERIPRPVPSAGEVLVRVRACAVNSHDLLVREGSYPANTSFPHVLGGDISGEVFDYGPNCKELLAKGSRVIVYWQRACGTCSSCRQGRQTTCVRYSYVGAHAFGGYAEFVVIPEENLIAIGDYDDWIAAAAFPMSFGTSWRMLVTKAQLTPGETVLVLPAASNVGLAATQIARLAGTSVIAAAGSDEKLETAVRLGAQHTVNYSKQDLRTEVARITNKRGVDVAVDAGGGQTWGDVVRCVTRNGRLVTCGGSGGFEVSMDLLQIFEKEITIIGSNSATVGELEDASRHLVDGSLTPTVDRVFALADAGEAHTYISDRQQFGKVVLQVGN